MLDDKNIIENNPILHDVVSQIIPIAKPQQIILYNCKQDLDGELSSFKLCIICDYEDKRRLLSQIFDIDCDIPFDVLLYSQEQFEQLREDDSAFANRIYRKGKMVYGR